MTSTYTPPTHEPKAKKARTAKRWPLVVLVVAAVGVIGVAIANKHADPPAPPKPPVELCAGMRDPSYDVLTPGDWQRLGDFSSHGLLVQYVTVHCPDQLARVDG